MKKNTDSTSNLIGAGELKEVGEKEQEGTSHARDQAAQEGSDCVNFLSAASLLSCTGNEGNEAHPPIRKVRGLTPPVQESDEENFPLWDAESDQAFELRQSQYKKSKQQLRDEIKTLTSTGEALRQHFKNQVTSIAHMENERQRLVEQCRHFAALVRVLPSGMVEEAMNTSYPHSFIEVSFNEAMYEHASEEVRSARKQKARMDKLGETQESSEGTSSDPED